MDGVHLLWTLSFACELHKFVGFNPKPHIFLLFLASCTLINLETFD